MAGRVAFAAYTIQRNIAAMQVAPTPALQVPIDPPAVVAPPTDVPIAEPTPEQLPTLAPAPAATAVIPPDPADPPPTPERPAYQPSATPVQLPTVDGANANVVALPTLMPVAAPPLTASNSNQQAVTILLLGSDRRPGEGWGTRSDAIMLVRVDPARQRVALLSLPRDLIVPIPGYGSARVNAATVYGELYPQLGGGTALARRTISEYLGIPIDHVVRADFSAFVQAVDTIGGVEIDVEQELYDPRYPTMDYGYQTVYFAPGPMWMDGETALIYSRVRHMDSNYARNRRQQQVILAILNRVRTQDLLSQVETIANLTTALRDDIQTDLSLEQMVGLAWAMRGVTPEMVERYAIDERMVSESVLANDPYATFANPAAVAEVARLLVNGP
jgi:polyisoprenyl-teichoic acid--peptidoglycan teichoic acid transferase